MRRWLFYSFLWSLCCWGWYLHQALQLLAGLAEIILIIAINNPNHKYSALILRALLFKNNNAANLRLTPATFSGAIMTIFGTLIRISTYHHLGKHFRFEASIQKDHELITGGPYSIVRHPSYTAILFTHSGWLLWQFGSGSWVRESGLLSTLAGKIVVSVFGVLVILVSSVMTFGRMTSEDTALQARFGVEWDQWATRVRYQIIPGIY